MGMIPQLLSLFFGAGPGGLRDTIEVFRANAEAQAQRDSTYQGKALDELSGEFALPKPGRFDRFMDALNRVPRPAMALGTIGLFVAAMIDPIWFASRMQGIALVPEPLWWLLGAIVSFYFGARFQQKGQEFQRSMGETLGRAVQVTANLRALDALQAGANGAGGGGSADAGDAADPGPDPTGTGAAPAADGNAALSEWRNERSR
jgi:hypothetical protein